MSRRRTSVAALLLVAVLQARAQAAYSELQRVNGEWERYWRVLQVTGDVPAHAWGNRPFGPAELRTLAAGGGHPWAARLAAKPLRIGRVAATASPVELQTIVNSGFPYGFNEGPVWAGRGATLVLRSGAALAVGPLSASIAPVLFETENASFPLLANGQPDPYRFGMPYPWGADLPQRFGDRAYGRLDAGNSFVRLDAGPIAMGFSTAAQQWGPARDHPIILGTNAGGFPHVFLGTAAPVSVGPIRIYGKSIWGRLSQSRYTPMDTVARHRLAVGAVVGMVPVAIPGLELGATRFVHFLWADGVVNRTNLLRHFGRFAEPEVGDNFTNQLLSVFARWVFASSGVEAYTEYAREDGNVSFRHFLTEPDHDAGYVVGIQRAWGRETREVVRAEVLETRVRSPHVVPGQNPFYVHSPVSQGHTHRGLALGSAGGFAGGATSLAYDHYHAGGRWSVTLTRLMRAEYLTAQRDWIPIPDSADVFHALGVDGIVFRGRWAITYEVTGVYELNRNFRRDAFNMRASSGVRIAW